MNRHRTIAAVTAAFGQIVDAAATAAVADAVVHYARPDTTGIEPKVYLYMYQATPNVAARNLELPVRYPDGVGRQRPIAALDLHYLLTFLGDDKRLQPQRMLGNVIGSIHARPILSPGEIRAASASASDPPLIGDDDEVPVAPVRFNPIGLNLDELSKVWSVFFQTPYALSVAYRASVVLVEADIAIRPPLPAQQPRTRSGFLSNPVIGQVSSGAGIFQPITTDSTLVITGKRLRGEQTLVRFMDGDVEPAKVDETQVSLSVPAEAQVSGVHSLRIVHRPWDADPSDVSEEVESNLVSFVVHPTIVGDALSGATLNLTIAPAVRQGQRVDALLDQLNTEEPNFYSLRAASFVDASATDLAFDVTDVAVGVYAIRVRVAGAASRIVIDEESNTVLHTVEISAS